MQIRLTCVYSLFSVFGLLAFLHSAQSEIIYDNSQNYLTNFNASVLEFGDEVHLAGMARIVTDFQFEYFGSFLSTGDETARVRFYANDGPGQNPTPKSLLYDSGLFPIFSGLNTVPISGIDVVVPDIFTWTVQFNGLTGHLGDQAGLVFYDPPTIGRSFDDYWKNDGTTWGLFRFSGNPKANFGARIIAIPDPPLAMTSTNRLTTAGFELQLTGPIGQTVIIQGSTDLVNWSSLSTNTFTNSFMSFVDSGAVNFRQRLYRAKTVSASLSLTMTSSRRLETGEFELQVKGPSGRRFVVQASNDLLNWLPISTNTVSLAGNPVTIIDRQAPSFSNHFYRAVPSL